MTKSLRSDVLNFVKRKYKISGDRPWAKYPNYVVLRHNDNRKWFGLIVNVARNRLGMLGDEIVDILNVKIDYVVIGGFINQAGIMPAYHMSKAAWATILLDGTVPMQDIEFLLNVSFELTKNKRGK